MRVTETNILVSDVLYIKDLDRKTKKQLKGALTFANPAYTEAKERGSTKATDLVPFIKFYFSDRKRKTLNTPKGCLEFVEKLLKENNQKYRIVDETITPELKEKIKFKGELRVYQKTAVKNCMRQNMGTVQAGTGAGKTVLALALIAKRKTTTLILVHSKELMYQWQERIKTFLDIDCGLIGDSCFEVKDITVGIINSVRMKTDDLYNQFGFIISDEVHKITASSWGDCIIQFVNRYSLGLSATDYRRDGLGNAIYAYAGLKQATVSAKSLIKKGAILKPKIIMVNTKFYFFFKNNYQSMIKALTENEERNNLIVKTVQKDLKRRNQNILIVSDRKNHCELIQKLLKRSKITSEVLTSAKSTKTRKDIVDRLQNGEVKIIISTVQLIGEGFDCPGLGTLLLTTPIRWKARVIQLIGRIMRTSKEKKQPVIYDFRDTKVEKLRWSGYARDRVYKELF